MELFYLMVHCKWVRFSVPIKQCALSRACRLDSAAKGASLQWLGFRMCVCLRKKLSLYSSHPQPFFSISPTGQKPDGLQRRVQRWRPALRVGATGQTRAQVGFRTVCKYIPGGPGGRNEWLGWAMVPGWLSGIHGEQLENGCCALPWIYGASALLSLLRELPAWSMSKSVPLVPDSFTQYLYTQSTFCYQKPSTSTSSQSCFAGAAPHPAGSCSAGDALGILLSAGGRGGE